MIIGEQIMALLWRAYGKEISGAKWIKVVFWILIGVVVAYGIVMTVECIRYGYEQWIYKKMQICVCLMSLLMRKSTISD